MGKTATVETGVEAKKNLVFLRFESPIAGATYSYMPGDVVAYDVDKYADEIGRLVERGIASEVTETWANDNAQKAGRVAPKMHQPKEEPKIETAAKRGPEQATRGSKGIKVATGDQDWPGGPESNE